MKKLLIILFALGLTVGASAQRYGHRGHYYRGGGVFVRPRVYVGIGAFAPYYGYGYPYYSYPPMYSARPSRLEMQIEDIKADYKDRIWSVKHDRSLSHAERRSKVRELKHEREQAIYDARHNYYKSRSY
ncbi:MAG: hypothetical protein ACJ748_05415 [Flavisolibacter sp.]